MATYTDLPDSAIAHKKPITLQQGRALRDNPIAMFEGADTAPRLQDAALGASPTMAGRDWVAARSAMLQAGAVGTYVLANMATGSVDFGGTVPGSALIPGTATSGVSPFALAGTWRAMGAITSGGTGAQRVTLFMRIS